MATPYASPSDLTGRTFLGRAPSATPYGDFTGPNPADVANDPYYQFRAAEGEKAIQHSAAKRGTLLTGGLLKGLERYRQGLASEEAGNAFNRALQTYGTNRDTNAQNFGQSTQQFRGDLDIFNANNNVGMGWAGLAPPASPGAPAGGDAMSMASGPAPMSTSLYSLGSLGNDYAAQVAAQRAQNAAESDRLRRPIAGPLGGGLMPPVRRGTLS